MKPATIPTEASTTGQQPQTSSALLIDFPTVGPADVAVFWDFENVRLPAWCPATTAAAAIRNKLAKYGRIVEKRLYYDSRQTTELSAAPRSDLDLSGFTLVDCPSRGRKETLDKKLIVDVLCFAWERASMGAKACVVLITSDGDYSYALARLRDIGVFTVIIYRPDVVAKVLIDNANVVMSWEFDVLGGPPASQGEEEYDDDDNNDSDDKSASSGSCKVTHASKDSIDNKAAVASEDPPKAKPPPEEAVKQPTLQVRGKFALFCSVVLNAQHRNVKEGISVYSSWADEGNSAATFYEKIGEKDREGFLNIRTLATTKNFIEWGRRNLSAPGKPVIKVKDRNDRAEGLSINLYLRLTYAGLSVVKPNIASKESDWTMVMPKPNNARGDQSSPTTTSTADETTAKTPNGKLFVGGLAWETTEDSLRSYFLQFGPLGFVLVKEGRGFGYVFFRDPSDAETVLKKAEHSRHVVDNKSVDVKSYST